MAEVLIALCLRDWQIERLVGRMGGEEFVVALTRGNVTCSPSATL